MGQKAYLFSRNLKVPEEIVNHNLKDFYNLEKKIYDKYKLDNLKSKYVSNFTSLQCLHNYDIILFIIRKGVVLL